MKWLIVILIGFLCGRSLAYVAQRSERADRDLIAAKQRLETSLKSLSKALEKRK